MFDLKKFKFKLEVLLKVTKMKKEQAEIKFAEATQILLQEQGLLAGFEQDLQNGFDQYYKFTAGRVTVAELMSYTTYFEIMKLRIEKKKIDVSEAEKVRLDCLALLQAAMNKLKTIEKLKEKRFEQFLAVEIAEEQKLLDEIGLQLYTRIAR